MFSDRRRPRPLTMDELWASWDPLIGEPWHEERLYKGKLGLRSLPDDASRTQKLLIMRDIFCIPPPDSPIPAPFRELVFPNVWDKWHHIDLSLVDKLWVAEQLKQNANERFKKGEWIDVLHIYAKAWGVLLPYHHDAYPAGDSRRLKLASMEFTILNNIMATVLESTKSNGSDGERSRPLAAGETVLLRSIGWRAGVMIIEIMFAADVRRLKVAVRRLAQFEDLVFPLDPGTTSSQNQAERRETLNMAKLYCEMHPDDQHLLLFDPKAPKSEEELHDMIEKYLHF